MPTLTIHQSFRGFARREFTIRDENGREYICRHQKTMEFAVYSDDDPIVETKLAAPRRSLFWGYPRQFQLFLEGKPRGFLRRSWLSPLTRDILILGQRTHRIPGPQRPKAKSLGIQLSWRFWSSRLTLSVDDERNLPVAICVLAWIIIRARYIEG